MPEIYLKHPRHGTKVANNDLEAQMDKGNGWVEFDPTAPADAPEPGANQYTPEYVAEILAENAAAIERAEKAEAERDEVKADLKEAKAELKKAEAALKKAEGELEKAKAKTAPATPPGTVPDFLKPEG